MAVVRNLSILCLGMLLSGFWSLYLGKELNWDLANYHYYNPFAFLTARSGFDHWPMEFIHVYLTPTLDFLTFFVINAFPPQMTMFLMGALHGINFWILFCIAILILKQLDCNKTESFYLALTLAFLGLYGPTVLPGIGSFQHDNLVSLFVLGYVYFQLKSLVCYFTNKPGTIKYLSLSAVLLGLGVGAKLTVATYALGGVFALLFSPLPRFKKTQWLFLLGANATFGMLISSGYWMTFLWAQFQNPVFPLWNGIFASPYFPTFNWHDVRFMPANLWQTIFYPFYFSWDGRTNDVPFKDFRFAITYVLLILFALKSLILFCQKKSEILSPLFRWFLCFFVFSYLIWQHYFSIMRYISALEMLAPLMIYLLLFHLVKRESLRLVSAFTLFFFLFVTMAPAPVVRAKWYEADYFNVKLPKNLNEVQEATVVMAIPAFALSTKPRPQTYLIPSFPSTWQFIGIPFIGNEYRIPPLLPDWLNQKKSVYVLASSEFLPTLKSIVKQFGFNKEIGCDDITSDRQRITHEDVKICQLAFKK